MPLSIVAFTVMYLLEFNLTTSADGTTLSVGFVVDDAIVMLENIVRHIGKAKRPGGRLQRGAKSDDRVHDGLWWPCSSPCCSWAAWSAAAA